MKSSGTAQTPRAHDESGPHVLGFGALGTVVLEHEEYDLIDPIVAYRSVLLSASRPSFTLDIA